MHRELIEMAKRRKRKEDPVAALLGLLVIAVFLGTFMATKSFAAAIISLFLMFAVIFAITFMIGAQKRERLRRSGIAEVDKMEGLRFERYLAELFKCQGYRTEVTQGSGDYGVDLILTRQGQRIAVQAKRYKNNVGLEAVQQVQAGKAKYNCSEAWVVTNSNYTDQAVTLAKANQVRLIGRQELIEMMLRMNSPAKSATAPSVGKKTAAGVEINKDSICKICGGTMQRRKSNKGEVYACSNYPQCKNVQAI